MLIFLILFLKVFFLSSVEHCNEHFFSTHSFEDGDSLSGQPYGVEHVVVEDALEEVVLVVGLEGRLAGHHLVHEHAQRPPVHGGAVVQLLEDLRGYVVRRAAEGGGGHAVLDALLAHAKVGDLAVALGVQQNVVKLQVSAKEQKRISSATKKKCIVPPKSLCTM